MMKKVIDNFLTSPVAGQVLNVVATLVSIALVILFGIGIYFIFGA